MSMRRLLLIGSLAGVLVLAAPASGRFGISSDLRVSPVKEQSQLAPAKRGADRSSTIPAARCGKLLPPTSGMYFGAQANFFYYAPGVTDEEDYVQASSINDFQRLAGRKIVWAYFTQHWFKGLGFPLAKVRTVWRNGQIPFIRLQPHSANLYGPPPLEQFPEQRFSLQHIIDGQFDPQLRAWADNARDTDIPILVEFGTEINGDWGPWNAKWNGAGQTDGYGDPTYPDGAERYRDAFRHLVTLFRQEAADNVTWFIHFDAYSQADWWNKLKWYYPGDDYVDWLGISNYGSCCGNPVQAFAQKLDQSGVYTDLTAISQRPMAVLETGVVEDPVFPKANWTRDAFSVLRSRNYPRIYGVAMWQTSPGGDFNVSIDTSPSALAAFRQAITDPFFGAKPQLSGDCLPPAPAHVRARVVGRTLRLAWRGYSNAARYEIWRNGKAIGTTWETSFADRRTTRHRRYRYVIRSVNVVGKGPFSRPLIASR